MTFDGCVESLDGVGKVSKSKELKRETSVVHDANFPLHRALRFDSTKRYG